MRDKLSFRFKKKIEWSLSASTDTGTVRKINQDNYYLMDKVLSCASLGHHEEAAECADAVLAAVCDGMGGECSGEEASYHACKVLEDVNLKMIRALSTTELVQYLHSLIQQMNVRVYDLLGRMGSFGGCTVVLLYSDDVRTVVMNVGDSSCMRFCEKDVQMVTIPDNQANRLFEQGEITEQERWGHKTKSCLTQCLGEDPDEIQIQPHIYVADAMKEGEIYLLFSDGLIDGVEIPQIIGMVAQNPAPSVAHALVEAAKAGGSRDNVTALFVQRKRL